MKKISKDELLEDDVLGQLEKVIDPELGIDIVNLGLIYNISCHDAKCLITMTLTIMGCPLSDWLSQEIIAKVTALDGIDECKINLVWEPVWTTDKMSRYAKLFLGIHG